jgi:phage regulator Rha-like protein
MPNTCENNRERFNSRYLHDEKGYLKSQIKYKMHFYIAQSTKLMLLMKFTWKKCDFLLWQMIIKYENFKMK